MALGIMGEYIGRLHLNVNRKPQYAVRQLLKGRLPRRNDFGHYGRSSRAAGPGQVRRAWGG